MAGQRMVGEFVKDGVPYCALTSAAALSAVKEFRFRTEDIVIVAYLKTGSTWLQEIVSALHDSTVMDPGRKATAIHSRVPQLESPVSTLSKTAAEHTQKLTTLPSPRLFKTHLRPGCFSHEIHADGPKIILLRRNPKDLLVSYYHYYTEQPVMGPFKGTWHDFFEQMVKQKKTYAGDWGDFLVDWTKTLQGKSNNVLCVSFEEMKEDIRKVVAEVAHFCSVDGSVETVERVVQHTRFENMRDNDILGLRQLSGDRQDMFSGEDNHHFRKGTVGDWRNYFSEAENAYMDGRCRHVEEQTGITFKFVM